MLKLHPIKNVTKRLKGHLEVNEEKNDSEVDKGMWCTDVVCFLVNHKHNSSSDASLRWAKIRKSSINLYRKEDTKIQTAETKKRH